MKLSGGHRAASIAIACIGLVIGSLVVISLYVADSAFYVYTLDDPYIHLSVAQNLGNGDHYGVNPGTVSAPSSSILWPILLAPFLVLGADSSISLFVNLLFAGAILIAFTSILSQYKASVPATTIAVLALAFAINMPGLVLMGMEHTLQVLCAVTAVLGARRAIDQGQAPWWFWAAVALGPMVRFENLAVSVPLLVWASIVLDWRRALTTATITGAVLVGFSTFLVTNELEILPSSVVAKTVHLEQRGSRFLGVISNIFFNLTVFEGAKIFSLALIVPAVAYGGTSKVRSLGMALGVAGLLHIAFGQCGWFHRYEVYMTGTLLAGFAVVMPQAWRESSNKVMFAGSTAVLLASTPYIIALSKIPVGSANIYSLQYQAHRLITEHLDEPVGANDLGWATFNNDRYVYDYLGLGNYTALQRRLQEDNVLWMDAEAERHQLRLVVLSPHFFPDVPEQWTRLGSLCTTLPPVTVVVPEFVLYATRAEHTASLAPILDAWASTLPRNSYFAPSCR